MYDKEKIYDNEVSPLMKQIIEICKREMLPMAAQFYLQEGRVDNEEPMYCTTVIIPEKVEMLAEAYKQLKSVDEVMKYGRNGKPFVMTTAIIKG